MGLFSFLKSKKDIEPAVEAEKISFGDIGKWIEKKAETFKGDEEKSLEDIGRKLDDFYVSIEEKLKVLEGIDIESKKEHGRAKLLVRQGLDKYVNSVRVLLRDLKNIDKDGVENLAEKIGKTFAHFEKTSAIFYGRANYLIGDEMAAVRNEIRKFYNGLVEIFEGEGSLIKNLKRIKDVKSKLGEFENVNKNLNEVGKEIETNDSKIEKAKKNVGKLEKEIEKIKESSDYTDNLKAAEDIKNLKSSLDSEIVRLKDLIDFKRLTNIVHSNERELEIVRSHKGSFVLEFSKDGGKKILDLLAASNMKSSEIESKVSLIEKKGEDLKARKENVSEDPTVAKYGAIRKSEEEIDGLKNLNAKSGRRLEEIDLKLRGLKKEVINLVEGFGVGVI